LIAVDHGTVRTDGKAAIGVAVERQAKVGLMLNHAARSGSRWVEPTP